MKDTEATETNKQKKNTRAVVGSGVAKWNGMGTSNPEVSGLIPWQGTAIVLLSKVLNLISFRKHPVEQTGCV